MPDTSIVVLIYCLYFRIIFIRIYHINADDISAHLIMCEYRQADIWKKHNLRVEVFGIYYMVLSGIEEGILNVVNDITMQCHEA